MKLFLNGMTLEDYYNDYKNCFSGWTVYYHLSPSKKWYFGITSQHPFTRWRNKGTGYKENTYFYRSIKKYGWHNIKHGIVATGLTCEQACKMEEYLIRKYNSIQPYGYNGTYGGEANIPGEEQRKKMSDARKKIRGAKHWNYGNHWSEEVKRKMSEAHQGQQVSEEAKIKMSKSRKGKKPSDNTIKASIKAHNKKVLCIETKEQFDNIKQANKKYKTTKVGDVCRGARKTAGGYHWKYVD